MRIFFAGPLTDLKQPEATKAFYVKMAGIARELGIDYFWAFLSGTDPIINADVSSYEIYKRDTTELAHSDIMIAYMGEPTIGTGIEVEYAHSRNIPVTIMYEKGKNISRMLLGCPAIKKEIIFTDEQDALQQLKTYLRELKGNYID